MRLLRLSNQRSAFLNLYSCNLALPQTQYPKDLELSSDRHQAPSRSFESIAIFSLSFSDPEPCLKGSVHQEIIFLSLSSFLFQELHMTISHPLLLVLNCQPIFA